MTTTTLQEQLAERTAELIAAHAELERTNSELMQVTLELDDRVAQRTAELHATNESLRASEEHFKFVFEGSPIAKSITQSTGEVAVNQAFCDLLGYSAAELAARRWQEISHPDDIAGTERQVAPLLAGASDRTRFTKRYLHKNGAVIWADVSTAVRRNPQGRPLYFITTVHNITERRRLDEALRASEERFRIATETANDVVYEWDLRQGVEWIGKVDELLGYAIGEFPRTLAGWLDAVHPDDRAPVGAALQAHVENRAPYATEYRMRDKGGNYRWWSARGAATRDAHGEPLRMIGTITDITERKQLNLTLEQRVRDRTAELQSANQELEAFSYSVSHDLRAPLRSIDGFSHILLSDYADKLDAEGHDSLNRIRGASQRMAQLIDDLLNLSRVTRANLLLEPVDLSALARVVIADLRFREPGRVVEITVADRLLAEGDPQLIQVVLENLLGNAWKFTGKRAQARIEFGAGVNAGTPAYFVRDNGAGFDPVYAGKLFGAFQRLHSNAEFPGTGIGLATVQRIVRRHGGRVWAEGRVDAGATFHFTLGADPSTDPQNI